MEAAKIGSDLRSSQQNVQTRKQHFGFLAGAHNLERATPILVYVSTFARTGQMHLRALSSRESGSPVPSMTTFEVYGIKKKTKRHHGPATVLTNFD